MKTKLLIAVTAAVISQGSIADTKAYASNDVGGKIVLTNEICQTKQNMLRSYKYSGKKHGYRTWEGCWKDDDITIYVEWVDEPDGQRYDKKQFKVVDRW